MADKDKETPAPSKRMQVVPVLQAALVKLVWESGGELPPELSGTYTSSVNAKDAARAYYAAKDRVIEFVVPAESQGKSETRRNAGNSRHIQPI